MFILKRLFGRKEKGLETLSRESLPSYSPQHMQGYQEHDLDYHQSTRHNYLFSRLDDSSSNLVIKDKYIGWGGILGKVDRAIIDNSRVGGGGCLEEATNTLIRNSCVSGGGVLDKAINPILIRSRAFGGGVLSNAICPIIYNSQIDGGGALRDAKCPLIITDFKDKLIINGITFVPQQEEIIPSHPYRGYHLPETSNKSLTQENIIIIRELPHFDTSGDYLHVQRSFYEGLRSVIEQVRETQGPKTIRNIQKLFLPYPDQISDNK